MRPPNQGFHVCTHGAEINSRTIQYQFVASPTDVNNQKPPTHERRPGGRAILQREDAVMGGAPIGSLRQDMNDKTVAYFGTS
mmetsp:Transcript_27182/g.67438  ORF Transcript_27182/g.67438 Transcript_27182/m.67438 type:complete len:82 (+) Transcript_27182:238-483(+)